LPITTSSVDPEKRDTWSCYPEKHQNKNLEMGNQRVAKAQEGPSLSLYMPNIQFTLIIMQLCDGIPMSAILRPISSQRPDRIGDSPVALRAHNKPSAYLQRNSPLQLRLAALFEGGASCNPDKVS